MTNLELSNKTIDELAILLQNISNMRNIKLKSSIFPYLDLFNASTNYGEMVEKFLVETVFYNLNRVTSENFDQITSNFRRRIETKAIRMMYKGSETSYESRAISILDSISGYSTKKNKYIGGLSTTTFQQVKPAEFESMIGVLVYKDGMDIFILNSDKIPNKVKIKEENKVYLTGQHKNNLEEGQISINDSVLNENYCFSIYNNGTDLFLLNRGDKESLTKFKSFNIEDF
jgi:hypothetical protein